MKKYISLLMFCGAFLLFQLLTSCNEDNTLEGAKEVYITISPKDPFIMVGDTVVLHAKVVNLNGDSIDTPIQWKSDDESLVKIYENQMIAQQGAQGKSTKIRAILENGKYALSTVTVTTHSVNGIAPFEKTHYTYDKVNDTIWFAVDPIQLLLDYTPAIENSDPELLIPNADQPIYVDKKVGKVGYVFTSRRESGKATVTLSIGPSGSEKTGSTEVVVSPSIISSFELDFNNITTGIAQIMDINTVDTVFVNTSIDRTYEIDLKNAEKYYNWKVEGNAGQLIKTGVEVVKDRGHLAYAVLRSGGFTGQTFVKFECNGTELTATVDVQNFVTQYPVDELTVNKELIEIPIGSIGSVTPTVVPLSSYGIHIPKFTAKDPSIVQVVGYNQSELGATEMELKGLKIGETDVVVTSNDKSVTIHVKVTDKVLSVVLDPGKASMFEGQTIQWSATVNSVGGLPIHPIWKSDDPTIASIDAKGVISGKKEGKVNITAEAGGVSSDSRQLTIWGIPTSDVNYGNNNTNADANAVVIEGKDIVILFEPTTAEPFKEAKIIITPQIPINNIVNATYSTGNSQISIEANGAMAGVSSGSITIASGNTNDVKNINADVTVTIGSKSFKIKLNNLTAYF